MYGTVLGSTVRKRLPLPGTIGDVGTSRYSAATIFTTGVPSSATIRLAVMYGSCGTPASRSWTWPGNITFAYVAPSIWTSSISNPGTTISTRVT